MEGEVCKDNGRFYYLTNLEKEDVLPSLIKNVKGRYHILEGKLKWGEELDIDKNYISIAPQFTVSYIEVLDVPIFNSIHFIFEPYTSKDEVDDNIKFAYDLDVLKCMDYEGGYNPLAIETIPYTKEFHDNLADRIKKKEVRLKGYYNAYYFDNVGSIAVHLLDRYGQIARLAKNHMMFMQNTVEFRNELIRNCEEAILWILHQMLHTYQVTEEEVSALMHFVKHRTLDGDTHILDRIINSGLLTMRFVAKDDPVFLESLQAFKYTFKIDLKKLKNDNKLYNIVMLKELPSSKVYVVMFKRKPIEYRIPEETGFNPQEMSKLLA